MNSVEEVGIYDKHRQNDIVLNPILHHTIHSRRMQLCIMSMHSPSTMASGCFNGWNENNRL